ncbi:MAG: metallophosphoesterase [Motiliproteus sp.]
MNIQRFKANTEGRDFVIGDLHGELDQLKKRMTDVRFDLDVDRLFSVGDLIDRGKHSKACFELLNKPWFHAVRGNHDDFMFRWLAEPDHVHKILWMQNGGDAWAEDPVRFFAENPDFRKLAETQILVMPIAIEVELCDGRRVGIVHACCPVKDWLTMESSLCNKRIQEDALWSIRANEIFHPKPVRNIDLTVHGHDMVKAPKRRGNSVYIDTGACLHGRVIQDANIPNPRLSMMQLEHLFEVEEREWSFWVSKLQA